MIDFDYLYKGLCGLANAHKAGTMAGHLGAAVVAGYFFGEDQTDLPKDVYKGVEGELERIIRGEEAIWFNVKRKLLEGFNKVHAGRGYYGKAKGRLNGNQVKLAADSRFPAYKSIQQMVDMTIGELIATASKRKQGFGGPWHLINHAAAITEIHRFGYKDLARQALPAHH